jgi:hypothetical protein
MPAPHFKRSYGTAPKVTAKLIAADVPTDVRPHVAAGARAPMVAHSRVATTVMDVRLELIVQMRTSTPSQRRELHRVEAFQPPSPRGLPSAQIAMRRENGQLLINHVRRRSDKLGRQRFVHQQNLD